MRPHPLALVSRQIQQEFLPLFLGRRLWPDRITLQVVDFDFESSVAVLQRSTSDCNPQFDVQVRVGRQLRREQWQRIWSWVRHWDSLKLCDNGNMAVTPRPKYSVSMEFGVCNTHVALHELYVEAVPYLLKSGIGQNSSSLGYREISAMKDALASASY
jgi:hypothetical protein